MGTKNARRRRPPQTGELHPTVGSALETIGAEALALDPKSLSLCAQARRALEYAIGGECRDEALCDLEVVEVMPDPTVRRLRVWLGCPAGLDEDEQEYVLARLAAARGFLRARIAQAIHRKRTPELVFELLCDGPDEAPEESNV